MRKRSNPSPQDGGARGLAIVGGAAVVIIVLGIVGAATDWKFGIGGGGDGAGAGGGDGNLVEMQTSKGTFTIELFTDEMPVTTQNFLAYVDNGFFEGTMFHRVSPTFVVQGGGFLPSGQEKDGELSPIQLEPNRRMGNVERTLAMARLGGQANSATSEFFINMKDNSGSLDSPPRGANDHYAVFGRVVDGWEVVEAIAAGETKPSPILNGEDSYPLEPVVIQRARVAGEALEDRMAFDLYAFQDAYDIMPGGIVSFPVVVRSTGNVNVSVNLSADFGGWDGALEMGHIDVALAPGEGDVNLVGMRAPSDATGTHTVRVTATPSEDHVHVAPHEMPDPQTLTFTITVDPGIGAPRAAAEENNLVQVRYVGIFADGRLFDTNVGSVWDDGDLPRRLSPGSQPHTAVFKAYLGTGDPGNSGYSPVIAGFREAIWGLAEGETAASRIPPEKGYRDGEVRIFMMTVLSIDGTA